MCCGWCGCGWTVTGRRTVTYESTAVEWEGIYRLMHGRLLQPARLIAAFWYIIPCNGFKELLRLSGGGRLIVWSVYASGLCNIIHDNTNKMAIKVGHMVHAP